MKKQKTRKINNIFIYILSFTASAVGISLNFFLARILEAEAYGQIQYLVALATTCSQLLIFGLNSFLIREAKNDKQNGEVVNKCFSLFLGIVIFFIPIMFYVLNNYVTRTAHNYLLSVSVLVVSVLMGANALISAYFHGNGKYNLSIIFETLLPKLCLLFISIVFLLVGQLTAFQENYLLFYIIIYSIVAVPFLIVLFRKINFGFNKLELKSIFFFFGVTVTYSLGNNLTKVLQGSIYRNDVVLGIISVSISIISLVHVFTSVLDNMVKPIFSKQKREGNVDGLLDTYRFDSRTNSYFAIPLYLFFILHPSKFLYLFGESYLAYPFILSILACANAVNDITGPNGTLLAMTGKEKWELFNGLLYFATYFSMIFVFSTNKVYGLSLALLVSQVVVNVAKYTEVWLIYKKTPLDIKTILSLAIILVLNCGAIYLLTFVSLIQWAWLIIGVLVGMVLVILNFFVFSLYRKNDFKQLINLRL